MSVSTEVLVSIVINIVAIAYFAGVHSEGQKNLKTTVEQMQKNFDEKVKDLKKSFQEKVDDLKKDFQERFNKVEEKQDKHNNLIERMVRVEDSTKSAHKRIDGMAGVNYDR